MTEEQVRAIIAEEIAKVALTNEETATLAQSLATRVQDIENSSSKIDEEEEKRKLHDENVERTNKELEGYMN